MHRYLENINMSKGEMINIRVPILADVNYIITKPFSSSGR